MSQVTIITSTRNVEKLLIFFQTIFCPKFQNLLFLHSESGISSENQQVIYEYLAISRHASTILGDVWWFNKLRLETSVEKRIEIISKLFRKWSIIDGNGKYEIRKREKYYNKIVKSITKLNKTYRQNMYIYKKDIDLEKMESDLKYLEALRGLGLPALSNGVSSAISEIFGKINNPKD